MRLVVKKGDLVEFKPGLFGIEIPDNYGIFVRSLKKKSSRERIVELMTTKGKQSTKQTNVMTKQNLGESLQLQDNQLPQGKEMTVLLKDMIKRVQDRSDKISKIEKEAGELSERALWVKVTKSKFYPNTEEFTVERLGFIWYGLEENELSRSRLKKIILLLDNCKPWGKGYFDFVSDVVPKWKPISPEIQNKVGKGTSLLGSLRNKMFHLIEVLVEEAEDLEETEIIKAPLPWEEIKFTFEEIDVFSNIQSIMAYFVENDSWPDLGIGDTHVYILDGFSFPRFMSYLAEDWVNEGKTSFSNAYVKLLVRTGYWSDTDALQTISRRVIKLATDFDWETPERIEKIAAKFQEPRNTPEVFEGRSDFQDLQTYTIDPPTAKDFDDAISLVQNKDSYILFVHIADVAHYVEKDSSLDLHARGRATSVYLPTKTLPMLPTHLSDNLCSLREQVPRLAMTAEIHFDMKGHKIPKKSKIHNSVIKVDKNLSYDTVNEQIQNQINPFYDFFQFSQLLNRSRRGLFLETDQVLLQLGGQMEVNIKSSSPATKMIETFMVIANETIAEILEKKKIPVIYRAHGLPERQDVERFNAQAKILDLDYSIELPDFKEDVKEEKEEGAALMDILKSGGSNISFTIGGSSDFAEKFKAELDAKGDEADDIGPLFKGLAQLTPEQQEAILKPFTEVIDKIKDLEDEDLQKIAYLTVLRVLQRAVYTQSNFGHFGLGSIAYLHFTSPIRRYPDVIVHRVCKAMINGEYLIYEPEDLETIANHCSGQSEMAEKLERTVTGSGFSFLTRNPKYSENREGVVSSIAGGGIFILLPNGIEARIQLNKMTDRPTFIDEFNSMCFAGFQSTDQIAKEITPENWRTFIHEDEEDPIEIIAKLGDRIAIEFTSWDHIEGRVGAIPISIESDE